MNLHRVPVELLAELMLHNITANVPKGKKSWVDSVVSIVSNPCGPSPCPSDLVLLRLYIPVNNFSVMLGRSHRFLGFTSTFRGVNVSLLKDRQW